VSESVRTLPANASQEELRARANELVTAVPWLHSIRLFPDLVVKGVKPPETLEAERQRILETIDIKGRTVLDVGSWNGYFSFEAKRLGAARVIASDSYTWKHPAWRGRETFELSRACLGLDIEAVEIDPTEMPGPLEPTEVVLFLGVFYHLFDPIDVLDRVASLAKDVLVVETHEDLQWVDKPAMAFYPGSELNQDNTNWWATNPECMIELLKAKGFTKIVYQVHPFSDCRGIYHAFRTPELAAAYLKRPIDNRTLFDLGTAEARAKIYGRYPAPYGARLAIKQAAKAVMASIKWRLGIRGR